jgi:DNA-binding FadR family transcriptional regulator
MRRRALRQHPTLAEAVIAGEPDRTARLADSHFSFTDETLAELRARLHLRSGGDTDARSKGQ